MNRPLSPLLGTLTCPAATQVPRKEKDRVVRLPWQGRWERASRLNPEIVTDSSPLFFPDAPDDTDTVRHLPCRAPVFLKSCSESICVLFKSRIKFLMPFFKFPGRNIKGSHAFPHTVTCGYRFLTLHKMYGPKNTEPCRINCILTAPRQPNNY